MGQLDFDLDLLEARWRRLKRALDADAPALTVLRARAVLEVNPDFYPVWGMLGNALIKLAHYEEAQAVLERAIEHCSPDCRANLLRSMGRLWGQAGDWDRAEAWYRRAIEADPDVASGYIYLGGLLAQRGRLAEAEEVHRAGTRCQRGYIAEAFLGLVLRAQERFREAARCFREAVRRDPEYRLAKEALRDVMACLRES